MPETDNPRRVHRICAETLVCTFEGGKSWEPPQILRKFLRTGDLVFGAPGASTIRIHRTNGQRRTSQFLYTPIERCGHPKRSSDGGFLIPTLHSTSGTKLFLVAEAVKAYFYALESESMLYDLLHVNRDVSAADLRTAWRLRLLELTCGNGAFAERTRVERAFNILADVELRRCYDAMLADEDAPPLFPYGGTGSILVEGKLTADETAVFADRILAYRPDVEIRRLSLPLRNCEFLDEHVICRDARKKVEVRLDRAILMGVPWDLTWNQSKLWLKSRLQIEATFVRTSRPHPGALGVQTWLTALPSRTHVRLPTNLGEDLAQANSIHALVGLHADMLQRIRGIIEKAPVEHTQVQEWYDDLGASTRLLPHHASWKPSYEPLYFEELRTRSLTWYLLRDEYLFVLPHALVSEIPQLGHATYLFAKPASFKDFAERYTKASREDIRCNRANVASELGFIGRVVRGTNRQHWLESLLRLSGSVSDRP